MNAAVSLIAAMLTSGAVDVRRPEPHSGGGGRGSSDLGYRSQFTTVSPPIRVNSRSLSVTTQQPDDIA